MRHFFSNLINRYFYDEEAVIFLLLMIGGFLVVFTMGGILAPLFASIILAYLMQGVVNRLIKYHVSDIVALLIAYALFLSVFIGLMLLLPKVWDQLSRLIDEVPRMITEWKSLLILLPQKYPILINEAQVQEWIDISQKELAQFGQRLFSSSLSKLPTVIALVVYLILVPILVFFLLKDRSLITAWIASCLPAKRPLMNQIWSEMHEQIANYVRGKAIEILIVGATSYFAFSIMGLNYAALLALIVGLSVLIPYVGATVVTIPVAMVGYFQWGWGSEFAYLMLVYGVIQALDGNVLVPLLFSEAVNLHPVAIIVAVLVFGGLWGFWGVFFAIPLATLIKAVTNAWPTRTGLQVEEQSAP